MALTENQKQILGMMTDAGVLAGSNRIAVAANDTLAISQIASYKIRAIPAKQARLLDLQATIAQLQADLVILQGDS